MCQSVALKSLISAGTFYELLREIKKVPRCHDQETFTVIRHIEKNEHHGHLTRPIVEINSISDVKLTQQDDILGHVYYSDENHKIAILHKMKDSLMDRFDTYAPDDNCFEVLCCKEIDKLIIYIDKNKG